MRLDPGFFSTIPLTTHITARLGIMEKSQKAELKIKGPLLLFLVGLSLIAPRAVADVSKADEALNFQCVEWSLEMAI